METRWEQHSFSWLSPFWSDVTVERSNTFLCLLFCVRQRKVIEWLLKHDPALRPTAHELLKSELLPPPQMEESELHEVLQHTMANVNGKAYRTMVGQLFSQQTSPVMDYTYDIDLHKVRIPAFCMQFRCNYQDHPTPSIMLTSLYPVEGSIGASPSQYITKHRLPMFLLLVRLWGCSKTTQKEEKTYIF